MRVSDLVPEVYYKESRDFSYIGRLMEIVFNYAKTAADNVNIDSSDANISSTMLTLLTSTIGFESKHQYINKDLIYIASTFSELLRNKGTKKAIETAIQLLLASQNIQERFTLKELTDDNNKPIHSLEILLPKEMKDIILLEDIFEYILPAGTLYKFTSTSISDSDIKNVVNDTSTSTSINKTDNELAAIAITLDDQGEKKENYNSIDLTLIGTGLLTADPLFSLVADKPTDWDTSYSTYYILVGNPAIFTLNTYSDWDKLQDKNLAVYKKN